MTNRVDSCQTQHNHPPLHPELEACLFEHGSTHLVRHWLIQSAWTGPQDNALLNNWLGKAKIALEQSLAEGDWTGAMLLYQRGWRLDHFERLTSTSAHADRITDREYWQTLGFVLIDQEDCYRQRDAYRRLLVKTNRSIASREYLMEPQEREAFAKLPDRLTAYRGCQRVNRKGWHWTLDIEKAKWFSRRWPGERPIVLQGHAAKKDVLAYFTRRNETDLLIDPRNIEGMTEIVSKPIIVLV